MPLPPLRPRATRAPLCGLFLLLLAGGCAGAGPVPATRGSAGPASAAGRPGDRPYAELTPQAQADIGMLIGRIPSASPEQRMEIATRLVRFGEAAVPQLVEGLSHPDPSVRITSAYLLGLLKDPRSLDALYRALSDPLEDVRFEAGTALLRAGDDRAVPLLIHGLEHPDPLVRARAITVLQGRTGSTLDFRPDATPEDRAAAVARWRAWYEQRRRRAP